MNGLLKLDQVSKDYAGAEGFPPVRVLRDISLDLERGSSLAVVGPSGCGKSTLLNIIGTLDRPDSGRVLLDGNDLSRLDDSGLASVRNRQIGFVFQSHHLLPHCSVLENVLVPTLVAGQDPLQGSSARAGQGNPTGPLRPAEAPLSRAERLLGRVGLGGRLHHRPGQISGGERQRVAVVRALINQPQLLLADEPTGSLDRASAEGLGQLLLEMNREEGVTLIVVTHAPDLARLMQRLLVLRDGALGA